MLLASKAGVAGNAPCLFFSEVPAVRPFMEERQTDPPGWFGLSDALSSLLGETGTSFSAFALALISLNMLLPCGMSPYSPVTLETFGVTGMKSHSDVMLPKP